MAFKLFRIIWPFRSSRGRCFGDIHASGDKSSRSLFPFGARSASVKRASIVRVPLEFFLTTRHDATRHDTTRHDTTRRDGTRESSAASYDSRLLSSHLNAWYSPAAITTAKRERKRATLLSFSKTIYGVLRGNGSLPQIHASIFDNAPRR